MPETFLNRSENIQGNEAQHYPNPPKPNPNKKLKNGCIDPTARREQMQASPQEYQKVAMTLIEGTVPDDWGGSVFVTSPIGSIDSNGMPYPLDNAETGTPMMNGNGFIFRFDASKNGLECSTSLMRTPCYFADKNAKAWSEFFTFGNWGISRISMLLGARNQLNTAVMPFQFGNDKNARILACYDAGRPWEFDPASMKLRTAIGANSDWQVLTADIFPFPITLSTAHPVFDPVSKEVFIVNYTKGSHSAVFNPTLREMLTKDKETFEKTLLKQLTMLHENKGASLQEHISTLEQHLTGLLDEGEKKVGAWLHSLFAEHGASLQTPTKSSNSNETGSDDGEVYLMRWDGQSLKNWRVVQDGTTTSITIRQSMHQFAVTEDYILLADATFKFSLDVLINLPLMPEIYWLLRELFKGNPQEPFLNCWIIRRSDLDNTKAEVPCRSLAQHIPIEAVHFSADYKSGHSDDGSVTLTLHLAHNSAACMAEWVRSIDKSAINSQPISPDYWGLISAGAMDIGRIGKCIITADNSRAPIKQPFFLPENYKALETPGTTSSEPQPYSEYLHTWGVGIYTYRDMISPTNKVDTIKHIFWQNYGLNPNLLTEFIYNLYKNYPNRGEYPTNTLTVDDVLTYTQYGVPFALTRQNTETMKLEDGYVFFDGTVEGATNIIMNSLQFIPRYSPSSPEKNVQLDPQLDGYILVATQVNYNMDTSIAADTSSNNSYNNYQCEIWVFDASNLQQGPICRFAHPQFNFAFTLHSAWIECAEPSNGTYNVDVKTDYDAVISTLKDASLVHLQGFFDTIVYPQWYRYHGR